MKYYHQDFDSALSAAHDSGLPNLGIIDQDTNELYWMDEFGEHIVTLKLEPSVVDNIRSREGRFAIVPNVHIAFVSTGQRVH